MQLASNHIFLTSSHDIADIVKPLHQLGITYFSYMKSDLKGGRIYLYNNSAILDSYLKGQYYLHGNKEGEPLGYKKQICLWSTLPNQQEYDENIRARGIDHGMFIFEPSSDSLEAFAFATGKDNERVINTYLTRLDVIKNFTHYFKEKAGSIIKAAERNKIILPFHNGKLDTFENDGNEDLHDDHLQFKDASHAASLSKRQMECCKLLLQGKTLKEIADALCLSARTVEYYIGNVKNKLNCKNKAELIKKLLSYNE